MQHTEISPASDSATIDQRSGARFGIALPITMEEGEGETLDISETGILFETGSASQPQVGAKISMTLEYSMDGHDYQTRCEAEVVRVERVGAVVNVATRLLTPLHSTQ